MKIALRIIMIFALISSIFLLIVGDDGPLWKLFYIFNIIFIPFDLIELNKKQ